MDWTEWAVFNNDIFDSYTNWKEWYILVTLSANNDKFCLH